MLDSFFSLFTAIEQSALGLSIRNAHTAYPLANIGHVLSVVIFFALVSTMDIVVLRKSLGEARETIYKTRGWARLFFLLALGTGLVMFIAEAGVLVKNTAFQLKMAAIGVAGLNLWLFGIVEQRGWLGAMRALALLSLLLWLTAIAAGRGIAYL
jgi:hypothetical protein